ncbi:MAG: SLBB domain-containing protein [Pseudomonadota bacterium]
MKRQHKKHFTALFLAGLAVLALTQAARAATPGSYTIGVNDILSISIFAGGKTQESFEMGVSSGGTIRFPFLGEIKAAGLTVPQLAALVTKPLSEDYFVNPQVIIRVKEFKSQKVYITGAVAAPGLYPLEQSVSLLELIAMAGGVTKDRGNFAFVLKGSVAEVEKTEAIDELIQKKGAVQVDLRKLLEQGRAEENMIIAAGDVVYIQPSSFSDSAQYKVYVLGKVTKPGAFEFQEGLTALDACTLAGGFDKFAAPSRTIVTRRSDKGQEKIEIDLDRVKEGEAKDMLLQPGDRVYVPRSWF